MYKHKYRVGDQVSVKGVEGTIFKLGHAESKGRNFHVCDRKHEIEDSSLLGYQVNFGNKVKIIKESDILPL